MNTMAFQITSLTIVYSTVYSGTDESYIKAPRHWLCVFVCVCVWGGGGGGGGMNSPHKGPVTRYMPPFDDVTEATPLFNKRT